MKNYIASLSIIVLMLVCLPTSSHAAFPINGHSANIQIDFSNHSSVDTNKTTPRRDGINFREKNKHSPQRTVAIYLAIVSILLGGLGLHRFYLGYIADGIVELLGLVGFIAGVIMLSSGFVAGTITLGVLMLCLLLFLFGIITWSVQIGDLVALFRGELTRKKRKSRNSHAKGEKQHLGWDNN